MENLVIEATKYTPSVNFDAEHHTLEIRGESYPENISEFYDPVFDWLKNYLGGLPDHQAVTTDIDIIYFNSNTSKVLTNFFLMLEKSAAKGHKIFINWYYDKENDIALEHGRDFREDAVALIFNLVQKQGRS